MTRFGGLLRGVLQTVADVVATATLTVDVPEDLPDADAAVLRGRLADLVRRRSTELGATRLLAPVIRRAPVTDRITVLLSERPVAVVPFERPPSEGWTDVAVRAADTALRRRLSVLVDVGARAAAVPETGRAGLIEGALARLVDTGISIDRVDPDRLAELARRVPRHAAAELAELLIDELAPREIVVEAAAETLRSVEGPRPDDLVRAREALFACTGVEFPDVRLVPIDERPGSMRITLNDVTVEVLVDGAGWSGIVAALASELREVAPWFVRIADVAATLDRLRDAVPDLVELAERCLPVPLLAACLREILRHGDSIRNTPRILWLLLKVVDGADGADRVSIREPGFLRGPTRTDRVPSDPVTLVALVRGLAGEDAGRSRDGHVMALPADVVNALLAATEPAALAAAERRVLAAVHDLDPAPPVLVGSIAAITPVRSALAVLPRPPRVVSAAELGIGARWPEGGR